MSMTADMSRTVVYEQGHRYGKDPGLEQGPRHGLGRTHAQDFKFGKVRKARADLYMGSVPPGNEICMPGSYTGFLPGFTIRNASIYAAVSNSSFTAFEAAGIFT